MLRGSGGLKGLTGFTDGAPIFKGPQKLVNRKKCQVLKKLISLQGQTS